ncbi:deoxynucleoside triphosphate triphosphohydrolase SAMHD1-like isoform X2 [Saccostrea echinata]|uniref:deoxynucleoside triphosphate triphosphohydrolase SAMHD1-like isoform X2 n=1 Tax=Saccostrea echinata TaxID=191078 RepID=UPI002A8143D8|nr:deoxynucleoside triphosphate triphosphohydrolase SAMHD1-like isoform X2 [Saccostrea echinata]
MQEPTTSEETGTLPGKIFNDPIWGPIKMNPVCVKIIDTPEFQRLRFIKQLGGCSFVYPGACHTRFEHSIGTSYLAGLLVRTLKDNMSTDPGYKNINKNISIDEKDILCVEIAGLCHDLGHGAFSHLFDSMFIPRMKGNSEWKKKIKNKIDAKKDFLYEIVANEENKIDVDKWDYFSRDCHMLGLTHNFQIMRSIMLARVIKKKRGHRISFPGTEYMNIFDMYHARYTLHRRAYQHPVNKAVELMITDALVLADDNLTYSYREGAKQKKTKLSNTIKNMEAYSLVTDGVIDRIRFENFKNKKFKEAKEIIDRIFRRDLYKCGVERRVTRVEEVKCSESRENKDKIKKWDIHIEPTVFSYGAERKNPMGKVCFSSAGKTVKPTDEKSAMLPRVFKETYLRMYWKKSSLKGNGFKDAKDWFTNLKEFELAGKRYIFHKPKQKKVRRLGAKNKGTRRAPRHR